MSCYRLVDTEIGVLKPEDVEATTEVSRDFQLEAVTLVREREVSAAQAASDLGLHENVLLKWVREEGL